LTVANSVNGNIELGRRDSVSSTPYIDFHSGGFTVDYDVRIISTGGGKWLNPDGKWPLPPGLKGSFALKLNDSGDYILELNNE
jgi:hypothetical protein